MKKEVQHRVSATFEVTDDLLWQAVAGRLPLLPPLTIERSGTIGPLVELAFARISMPSAYRSVTIEPSIFNQVVSALSKGEISGAGIHDRAGVFPLSRYDPSISADNALWNQWTKHAENAAVVVGLPRALVVGLIGAIGELQDNVFEHSGQPASGLLAYGVSSGTFEFVVADAGRGVLASLRENQEYAHLTDSGSALRVAISDGASRYARNTGHGYGVGQLFRALANHSAELRFRSGDHALRLWGHTPSLTGQVELTQKAWLSGLVVSVRCTPGLSRRGQ